MGEIASIDTVRLDMGGAESKHCYSEVRQGWGQRASIDTMGLDMGGAESNH